MPCEGREATSPTKIPHVRHDQSSHASLASFATGLGLHPMRPRGQRVRKRRNVVSWDDTKTRRNRRLDLSDIRRRERAGRDAGTAPIDVWASRTGTGITGASNSVITSQEIAPLARNDDPGRAVAGSRHPDWSTAGGINGATTTVDLRGSAQPVVQYAVSSQRPPLNDVDLLGVDLSAIPATASSASRSRAAAAARCLWWRRSRRCHQHHYQDGGDAAHRTG